MARGSRMKSRGEALGLLERDWFDVGVFDINMPGMSGLELLQRVRQANIDLEVVMLTGQGTIDSAVAAMKMGASDFLTKPYTLADLEHHCHLAHDRRELKKENKQLKAVISRARPTPNMIGESEPLRNVGRTIDKVAPTSKPVLIQGESGTGKEIVALAIQRGSRVADKPFVTVNCAALPENLVESESTFYWCDRSCPPLYGESKRISRVCDGIFKSFQVDGNGTSNSCTKMHC